MQSGIWEASEVETSRGSIRIQHLTAVSTGPRPLSCSVTSGSSVGPLSHNPRFPKLEECAHFHYDVLELPVLKVISNEIFYFAHHIFFFEIAVQGIAMVIW